MKIFNFLKIWCFVIVLKLICYLCESNQKVEKSQNIIYSDGFIKNIIQHTPTISKEEIEDSEIRIVEQAHEEEKKITEKIHMCIKDYKSLCPKDWIKIEKNGKVFCRAEVTYNGFCEVIQSFENFNENDKINFESSCNVEWPCKSEVKEICKNGRDYFEPCPEGFILQKDDSCKADMKKYNGYCSTNNINFTHMTSEEKEKWSNACEAFWPCYEKCEVNQNLSACPKYWIQEKNSSECMPTENYHGPCKNKKSFTYFTNSMKKEFEEKCKTRFECVEGPCEKDYTKKCPVGWKEESGTCVAPSSFNLCNRKKISIENTTVEEKKQFEKECSVEWPCKQEFCEMAWNLSCPDGWTQHEKNNINIDKDDNSQKDSILCEPPIFYKGKCEHIVLNKNSDENTKRELASSCDAPWSCINKEGGSETPVNIKVGLNEVGNGPITVDGRIVRSSKYSISDDTSSKIHDIMQ